MQSIGIERTTIQAMIRIYCRNVHGSNSLCGDCTELLDYAFLRIEKCPSGPDKPACADCTVHCYKPGMREKIRQVMRFAGPRMIWKHPVLAVRHMMR